MAAHVMMAKSAVLFFFCVINGVYLEEASYKMPASSLDAWYCHRLVPAYITAVVTPCTYPCLFLSPHEHPRIIVHPEQNGTPCRIATSVGHHYQVGNCGGSVCRPSLPHTTLKRKKRFICLYALVRMIKMKKRLKELKEIIQKLEKEAAVASTSGIGSLGGAADGTVGTIASGPGRGASVNLGSGEGVSSGGLGVDSTSISPGGNPATLNIGNVGGNGVLPGIRDASGPELFSNAAAGSGSPGVDIFGLPREDGRPLGSGISSSSFANTGAMGGSASGLGGNAGGRTGAAGISGNNNGGVGIGSGSSTSVSPGLDGNGNNGALGSSSSASSSSRSVLTVSSIGGTGGGNVIGFAASGSTATGMTSSPENNRPVHNSVRSGGPDIRIAAARS